MTCAKIKHRVAWPELPAAGEARRFFSARGGDHDALLLREAGDVVHRSRE